MSIDNLFKERKSVRSFSNKEINRKTILELLSAARFAPSAVNYQPWLFFVCSSNDIKVKIIECYPRKWFENAPLYIVACVDKSESWKRPADNKDHGDIDVAIAVTHLILKATELGLGTCWVCNFDANALIQALDLDKNIEPTVIIPIGYPSDKVSEEAVQPKKRKSVEEFTQWL